MSLSLVFICIAFLESTALYYDIPTIHKQQGKKKKKKKKKKKQKELYPPNI